jgi:predicted DNA-binding transcriptional regulator AlpA
LTAFGVTFVATSMVELDDLERTFSEAFDGLISRLENRLLITVYGEGSVACGFAMNQALALESLLDVQIIRVDQDLVDIPEIARRTSRSRQNIQQLVTGTRGSKDFPDPLGVLGEKRVWDWASVNEWLRNRHKLGDEEAWLGRDDVSVINAWLVERRANSKIEIHPGTSRLGENVADLLMHRSAKLSGVAPDVKNRRATSSRKRAGSSAKASSVVAYGWNARRA